MLLHFRCCFFFDHVPTEPGVCIKTAPVDLIPLAEVATGTVIVETKEGPVTVEANDFYLARGVQGEIWPITNAKVESGYVLQA